MALGKHCRFHLVRIEDEHPTFSSTTSDKSSFLFDKAFSIVDANLHALFHYMADLDQIVCYCRNMQDVLDVDFVVVFLEWDITDIFSFHIVGSFGIL